MEQTLDISARTTKIYNDKAIWVGTFLGGPLAAGYLIAQNFKAFDEFDKAKKTWIYTILATAVIFGGAFLIADNVNIPNQIIPLIYTVIAYYLVQRFQLQNISDHISSGGQLYSWWRTIAVAIIGLAITIVPIFSFALLTEAGANPTTKTYGIMKHEITFDNGNITEAEVDQLADGLTGTTFFDDVQTKFVYAKKINGTYEIYISVINGTVNDNEALQPFIDLRRDLQTFYPNNQIVFKLVVDNLDNVVKTIE